MVRMFSEIEKIMLTFCVVLKSGGDYIPEDPIILSRQVYRHMTVPHRFVCLTDMDVQDDYVEAIPLKHGWPGWWSLVETFRMTGPVIVTGLDTLIVNDINPLAELALTCPPDVFYMTKPQLPGLRKGKKMNSGVMMWNGDWSWLYKQFKPQYISRFGMEEKYTEWQLVRNKIRVWLLQDYFTGFYSYKLTVKPMGMPQDARIVAFHGKPRPRQVDDPWVVDILNDYSTPEHYLADVLKSVVKEGTPDAATST